MISMCVYLYAIYMTFTIYIYIYISSCVEYISNMSSLCIFFVSLLNTFKNVTQKSECYSCFSAYIYSIFTK